MSLNNKIPIISFCCENKVMSSRPEAVAEAGDVWEEMAKNMVLAVPHCPEQFLAYLFTYLTTRPSAFYYMMKVANGHLNFLHLW